MTKDYNVNSEAVINKLLQKISNLEYQLALVTVAFEEASKKEDNKIDKKA